MSFLKVVSIRIILGNNQGATKFLKNRNWNETDDITVLNVVYSTTSYVIVIPFEYCKLMIQNEGCDLLSAFNSKVLSTGFPSFWSKESFSSALVAALSDGGCYVLSNKLHSAIVKYCYMVSVDAFHKVVLPFISGFLAGSAVALISYPCEVFLSLANRKNILLIQIFSLILNKKFITRIICFGSYSVLHAGLHRGFLYYIDTLLKDYCKTNDVFMTHFPNYTSICLKFGLNPAFLLTYPSVAISSFILYPLDTLRQRRINNASGHALEFSRVGLRRGRVLSLFSALSTATLYAFQSEAVNMIVKRVGENKIVGDGGWSIIKEHGDFVSSQF